MQICFGIDPGATGALAKIEVNHVGGILGYFLWDYAGDEALEAMRDLIHNQLMSGYAFIERAQSMPKQGVASTFKFGTNYGEWLGMLKSFQVPYEAVGPFKWKKAIMGSKREKEDSLELARNMFPGARSLLTRKKDHNRAEALLIAEYCRRVRFGLL